MSGTLEGMGTGSFDPLALTAEASLNQVVIGDAGCPEVAGMPAGQACSRQAMLALAAERGLTGLEPGRLSDGIATAAASTRTGHAAAAALEAYGNRLGALIATLRDPRTPGEQGRTPARHAYLSHWLEVDSIWLGGGLLAGSCGPVIRAAAQAGAAAAVRPCRVALVPYPAIAPLLGAARRAPATGASEVLAVADLGHTSIKTAIAERRETVLTGFWLLGACPAPSGQPPDQVEATVTGALARAVRHAAVRRNSRRVLRVIVSVASYLSAGAPADDGRGIYGCLANRVASMRSGLSADGTDVTLEFVHDGTAAATAGTANSATITAGTWLGSGFRPGHAPASLDLAADLRIGHL